MADSVPAAVFTAMTVEVTILGNGVTNADVSAAAALGRSLAEVWELEFSRFRPESTLCRLNAAEGRPLEVTSRFLDMLDAAQVGVRATDGRFNPAVLGALEAAGYDRTFAEVSGRAIASRSGWPSMVHADWDAVEIDRDASTVRLPAGMRIDLGGIAKGGFVDALADALRDWPGGMIDAGGDLRVWGSANDGPWAIAVEHPGHLEEDLLLAEIVQPRRAGGVATSGTNRRQWTTENGTAHHLIDPVTGSPVVSDHASATAFASSCVAAEIATKALMIGGAAGVLGDLARGLVLDADGRVLLDCGTAPESVRIS